MPRSRKIPPGKIITPLPRGLKVKLKEPAYLKEITFQDLQNIHDVFKEFKKQDEVKWKQKACNACTPKLGH